MAKNTQHMNCRNIWRRKPTLISIQTNSKDYNLRMSSWNKKDLKPFVENWPTMWYFTNNILCQRKVKVAQLCLTLCDPMDYMVYGILQARKLEWVAVPFSRASSQSRDQTQVSCIAGRFFTICGEGNVYLLQYSYLEKSMKEESEGLRSMGLQRVRHDW